MMTWIAVLTGIRHDSRGITAVEYALVAGLVALGVVTGATALGTSLNDAFSGFSDYL